MHRIRGEVFTYADFPPEEQVLREGTTPETFGVKSKRAGGPTWATVQDVRGWPGYRVTKFEELVKISAHLSAGNREHMLFYRGQSKDYLDRNGRTNLYPTLYRGGRAPLKKDVLATRWQRLGACVSAVVANRVALKLPGKTHRHIESAIALLQHYGLAETPLLDVTPSLRVAASFALAESGSKVGYLYVLALPYPHGTISHFVDHDMVVVRLHGICPYEAIRPHYQEGYLVGKFPISDAAAVTVAKERNDNAASRLVAKLILDDTRGTFFSDGFPRVPAETLLPAKDPFGEAVRRVVESTKAK